MMNDDFDLYFGLCLKNWAAKYQPPCSERGRLLYQAAYQPKMEQNGFARYFSAFANRWASPGEQYYSNRHWQLVSPFNHSLSWSIHLATHQKLAN